MPKPARTKAQIVDYLLNNAINVGECWECHLACSRDRYKERHYVQAEGKRVRVTRLVWEILEGPIPDGMWVLHSCDNTKCISIEHLFLGTPQDNTQDMLKKGRASNGDNSQQEVRKLFTGRWIKGLLDQGLKGVQIAHRLHISTSTVSNYVNPNGVYHEYLR